MYIKREINLGSTNKATNMTSKNGNFEQLVEDMKLKIVDKEGKIVGINSLNDEYKAITFNDNKKEYLTLKGSNLVVLNNDYEEVETIPISKYIIKASLINDIFYDNSNNKILVSSRDKVISLNDNGKFLKNEVNTLDFYQVEVYVDSCKQVSRKIPDDFAFLAVGRDDMYKYVAYTKNNSTFLAKVSESGTKIGELYLGDNIDIDSIAFNEGIYLNGLKDGNNIIYEISLTTDSEMDNVIQDILNSLRDLLDKVSGSEESIANIVSTEADKVKKVIDSTSDVDKILEVNESILPVISEAVALEQYERSNLNDIVRLIEELLKDIS